MLHLRERQRVRHHPGGSPDRGRLGAGVTKLQDANDAGTRLSAGCTLILTEGDSAKALVIDGLSVAGRDSFGVFPLRSAPGGSPALSPPGQQAAGQQGPGQGCCQVLETSTTRVALHLCPGPGLPMQALVWAPVQLPAQHQLQRGAVHPAAQHIGPVATSKRDAAQRRPAGASC